jgi:hypothetical protein
MRFDNSQDCTISQLDLFTIPNTQSVLNEGVWQLIPAEADFNRGSVIFKISGNDSYLDLPETELIVHASIRKEDSNDVTKLIKIDNADQIGPVNNFLSSIFSQIQVSMNDTEVENSNETYHYRSYFENLLNYDQGAKNTFYKMNYIIKMKLVFLISLL